MPSSTAARQRLTTASAVPTDHAGAPMSAKTEFALITKRADFDALEADWNALFERAANGRHVFQSFNFLWHWANHYLEDAPGGIAGLTLSIVTARRDGRLILVWPLVSQRVRGIRQVFWMGDPVGQYGDVIVDTIDDKADVLRQSWQHLAHSAACDVVRLRRVRADAVVAPLLVELGARVTDRLVAPYLDLASATSFADYEKRYSADSRRNRKRYARRLDQAGTMTFERIRGGAEARTYAASALALKAEWLKTRGLVSYAISDSRMARFFADAAEGAVRPTNCVISVLKSAGETAALDVSFVCKGHLAMHVTVYNLRYEKSAAGVLLLEQCVRDSYADNIATFDMLAPGHGYKMAWADGTIDVIDWAQPMTMAGYAYARIYLEMLRTRVKSAIHAMPGILRRAATTSYGAAAARP